MQTPAITRRAALAMAPLYPACGPFKLGTAIHPLSGLDSQVGLDCSALSMEDWERQPFRRAGKVALTYIEISIPMGLPDDPYFEPSALFFNRLAFLRKVASRHKNLRHSILLDVGYGRTPMLENLIQSAIHHIYSTYYSNEPLDLSIYAPSYEQIISVLGCINKEFKFTNRFGLLRVYAPYFSFLEAPLARLSETVQLGAMHELILNDCEFYQDTLKKCAGNEDDQSSSQVLLRQIRNLKTIVSAHRIVIRLDGSAASWSSVGRIQSLLTLECGVSETHLTLTGSLLGDLSTVYDR